MKNHMDEYCALVIHAYWAAAVCAVLLRAVCSPFEAATVYGSRRSGTASPVYPWWLLGSCSRKRAFIAFYAGALLSCALLSYFFGWVLPLLVFAVHAFRRLCECVSLQQFRAGSIDRVSGFAAVAGASFYWFAAITFCLPSV